MSPLVVSKHGDAFGNDMIIIPTATIAEEIVVTFFELLALLIFGGR